MCSMRRVLIVRPRTRQLEAMFRKQAMFRLGKIDMETRVRRRREEIDLPTNEYILNIMDNYHSKQRFNYRMMLF
jgi:hypothetical protein